MSVSVRGISSGIDINGIIEELMALERQPIRRKEAQIERTEQIAELWREVNSRLDTLKRTLAPLQNRLTFTAPVPASSNEEVMRAKISGQPTSGSYRFNVTDLATYHSVASNPPTAGDRISSTNQALGLKGTFYLGTGRPPEGLEGLSFNEADTGWLRGNFGAGFQAVISEGNTYMLNPESLQFTLPEGADNTDYSINVYMNSFTGVEDVNLREELEDYFADKGWVGIDLDNDPLFTIQYDSGSEEWVALNQADHPFGFEGDHPLGKFNLRGEIVHNGSGETVAVNNFDFQIRDTVDETGFIKIGEDDSLLVIADKINNKIAETGVRALVRKVAEGDYRLILESTKEGKAGFIQAYDYSPLAGDENKYGEDSILSALNLFSSTDNAARPDYMLEPQEAQDAVFTLDGLTMTRTSNTFTDVIDGLEINLRGEGPAILDLAPDTDAAAEEINLFVEAVNEVNSYLRVLQKNEEGPLQGSTDLMRIERQLRTLLGGPVFPISGSVHSNQSMTYTGAGGVTATASGTYDGNDTTLELIYHSSGVWRHDGIDFESGDTVKGITVNIAGGTPAAGDKLILNVSPPSDTLAYTSLSAIGILATDEEGILQIDNAKLQEALAADPEGVFKLFALEAPKDPAGRSRGPDGIAVQVKTFVENQIGFRGVVTNRQDYYQRQIQQYQDRIEMMERRMEMREQRLVRQFTFMEQYIARIQEQTGLVASFELMMQGQRDR